MQTTRSIIRFFLLTSIALSLMMMSAKVFSYLPLLASTEGRISVIETASVLFSYALFVVWVTKSDSPLRHNMLLATPMGVLGGAVQIARLTQEQFRDLGPLWNGSVGFGLLFCTFGIWGLAGFRSTRKTGVARLGAMAGLWSAIVTMSMLVLFGFVVELYLAMPRPESVVTWGEFKRSGWTDVHAFTIANTLDAASSHLIAGPILGVVFASAASLIALFQAKTIKKLGHRG